MLRTGLQQRGRPQGLLIEWPETVQLEGDDQGGGCRARVRGEHARPSGGQSEAMKGEQGCDENEAGDLEVCGVQVSGLGGLSIAGRVGIASTPVGVASTVLLVLHKTRPDSAKGLWSQVWLMAGGGV